MESVNSMWSFMTLTEKIAQLIFVRIGSNLPPIVSLSADEERIAALLDEVPIGGLLAFNGDWPEIAGTLARLQAKSRTPLLVAADLERGAGQQAHGLTVFPHARVFAELGSDAATDVERACGITANEALRAGIQILFAPVADANTNPANPIIATRAYGEQPAEVAQLVAAATRGIEATGAFATAKHFPGHGDTDQDSHAELPSVNRTREELDATELIPFRAAIDAGVSLIMTAHVSYPALDPTGAPATFSEPIIKGLLCGELGFDGVVCSDSLLMAGASLGFASEGEMAAAALRAGVDLLLDIGDPVNTAAWLAACVERGDLSESRIDEALARVLALKQRMQEAKLLDCEPFTEPQLDEHRLFAASVARRAVRVENPGTHPTPLLTPAKSTTAILIKPFNLPTDPSEQPLAEAVRDAIARTQYFEFGPEPDEDLVAQCVAAAKQSEQVLLAIIAKPAAWHAFGINPAQQALVDQLTPLPGCIVASLGVPTVLDPYRETHATACTLSDVPDSQRALVGALVINS